MSDLPSMPSSAGPPKGPDVGGSPGRGGGPGGFPAGGVPPGQGYHVPSRPEPPRFDPLDPASLNQLSQDASDWVRAYYDLVRRVRDPSNEPVTGSIRSNLLKLRKDAYYRLLEAHRRFEIQHERVQRLEDLYKKKPDVATINAIADAADAQLQAWSAWKQAFALFNNLNRLPLFKDAKQPADLASLKPPARPGGTPGTTTS